jgi:hypothetical protein
VLAQCRDEPARQRYVSQTAPLRYGDMPIPIRLPYAQLTIDQIHVAPVKRDHLSASQPGVSAEQHDHMDAPVDRVRPFYEPLIITEVVERSRGLVNRQELDGARHVVDHLPFDSLLQQHAQDGQNVVDRLRRFRFELTLQSLHVFARIPHLLRERSDRHLLKPWEVRSERSDAPIKSRRDGDTILESLEGGCRPDIGGVVKLLDPNRNAVQWPAPSASHDFRFRRCGVYARLIAQYSDEGVQSLIQPLNARKAPVEDFDGRDLSCPEECTDLRDAQVVSLFVHWWKLVGVLFVATLGPRRLATARPMSPRVDTRLMMARETFDADNGRRFIW